MFYDGEWRIDAHEGSADERDEDHGQPRRHLGEAPEDVGERESEAVLLNLTVEWVPVALIRGNLLVLAVDEQLLERLGGGGSAVQGQETSGGGGSRLVGQRLGDLEVVERRRADRPRVAEELLLIAVDDGELGRVGLGGQEGKRCLWSCQFSTRSWPCSETCGHVRSKPGSCFRTVQSTSRCRR